MAAQREQAARGGKNFTPNAGAFGQRKKRDHKSASVRGGKASAQSRQAKPPINATTDMPDGANNVRRGVE